jgi:ABC-2 type transport system ATP-binding protein
MSGSAIEAHGLGRRYGRRWALRHLDLAIPERAVVGVVGPNGAGKSTLLELTAGLIGAHEGRLSVLGGCPGAADVLPDVAFVGQDAPLPRRARLGELVAIAAAMNPRFDAALVRDRCAELGLDRHHRVAGLSGGQRAQIALALALAKQPRLLLLDEPVASLDPLARRSFLQALMAAVCERDLTVVFSTHLLDDLERACDHLVVLGAGRLRLAAPIEDIVAGHAVLVGPVDRPLPPGARVVGPALEHAHQRLVALDGPVFDRTWAVQAPQLEEIVFAHLSEEPAPARRLEVV